MQMPLSNVVVAITECADLASERIVLGRYARSIACSKYPEQSQDLDGATEVAEEHLAEAL